MHFDAACNWHHNETVTVKKHISKYKNIQKSMIKFLKKFENHCIKIARVKSILITKSINLQLFTLIVYSVGVHCDRRQFSMHSLFIEKSMV